MVYSTYNVTPHGIQYLKADSRQYIISKSRFLMVYGIQNLIPHGLWYVKTDSK